MSSKAVLGLLAALGALAVAWLAFDRRGNSPSRGRSSIAAEESGAVLADDDSEPPVGAVPPRDVREAVTGVETAPVVEEPTPRSSLFASLSGRVVDEAGAPIAGAEVVLRRPEVGHFTILDLETRQAPREVTRVATDAAGRFSFELERGIPFALAASARDFCDEDRTECYAGQELEIVLSAGFLVHGSVRRERNGAPIAGAGVKVFQVNHPGGRSRQTTTAEDGSYRLRVTFQEDATLEVVPQRERSSDWLALEFDETGTAHRDVLLQGGIEVRGKVVEAGTLNPIEGARIGEGWTYSRSAVTDVRGEYALSGFGVAGYMELFAKAPGYGEVKLASLPVAVDGVMRVDFELPRGRRARGRVLDPEGRPLAGAYVAAVADGYSAEGQVTDWVSGRTDLAGSFELSGLMPKLSHCLLASAEGFSTKTYDFPDDERNTPDLDLGDVQLDPPAVLSGTVQDDEGTPLAGLEVTLSGANSDRGLLRGATTPWSEKGGWYVDSRHTVSDARGRFWFGALPAGRFAVHAQGRGRPPSSRVGVTLEEGELRDGFVLVYARGELIHGAVVDAEGRGLGGVYVQARLRVLRGNFLEENERETGSASVRTGVDGLFELHGLPAGNYRLHFYPFETEQDPDAPWLSTELDAETVSPDAPGDPLRIVLPRGASIRGQLIDVAGSVLVGYMVVGKSADDADSPTATSAEDGSFVLQVRAGTLWDLEVQSPWQSEAWDQVFHRARGIAAGTRGLELIVDVGEQTPGSDE